MRLKGRPSAGQAPRNSYMILMQGKGGSKGVVKGPIYAGAADVEEKKRRLEEAKESAPCAWRTRTSWTA